MRAQTLTMLMLALGWLLALLAGAGGGLGGLAIHGSWDAARKTEPAATRGLLAHHDAGCPGLRSIGYAEIVRHLAGDLAAAELAPAIVRVTLDMAGIILTAAGLGFIGLGAQPPLPEWGAMISRGRVFILDQWWVATMPGFAIILVSLGFCLLGDGLRDVLDPKSAGKS